MIQTEYVGNPRSLEYATIEACLEVKGKVNGTMLSGLFGIHRSNGARIITEYQEATRNTLQYFPLERGYITEEALDRAVLSKNVGAFKFLTMLETLLGHRGEGE